MSKRIVEFQTPADTDGLGTASRLVRNGTPISGVAILYGEEPNLLQLSLRLTSDTADLAPTIVLVTEGEAARFERGQK